MALFDSFVKDVGIDLGTANTLIHERHKGLVIDEPTVAAINTKTNQIIAVGDKAKKMLGRTPSHINVVRPLQNGVVSDFDMAYEMLRQFLKSIGGPFGFRRGILGIPNDLTEVERKSVEDVAKNAGVSKVHLIESLVASALGADLPIEEPTASLVVDIGGGTSDIGVISMGGIVISRTLKVAGDKFNEDVIRFYREEFKLAIGEPTAEFAKIAVGSAIPVDEKLEVPIRGRDLATGLPREIIAKNIHIRAAIAKSLSGVLESLHEVIEETPAELTGDMLRQGVTVCGGGAMLRGLSNLIEKEASVTTRVAPEPLTCMVRGLGRIVDGYEHYQPLLDNPLKPIDIQL